MNPYLVPPRDLLDTLARNWWLFLVRGALAILLGVIAIAWPAITLVSLALVYGAYALADGVVAVSAAIRGGSFMPRWWLAVVGVAGVLFGVATILWPGMTVLILVLLIAAWSIASGIMQIIGAMRLRNEIPDEWLLVSSGVVSVLFGLVLLFFPSAGALGLVFAIGIFAIVYGILLVSFALRLRKDERMHGPGHVHA
jgi:uncharacterized membrane protein HdeD (DUF308 family)